ncbi:hypothetical protein ACF07Y_36755 [Streptomyces sp. NPDC016566]|uniref:hypothetical protein n=1 Tax=Streptomyces sp. NPDC016566 TaxID=3364967 RepID=UPI003701594C
MDTPSASFARPLPGMVGLALVGSSITVSRTLAPRRSPPMRGIGHAVTNALGVVPQVDLDVFHRGTWTMMRGSQVVPTGSTIVFLRVSCSVNPEDP